MARSVTKRSRASMGALLAALAISLVFAPPAAADPATDAADRSGAVAAKKKSCKKKETKRKRRACRERRRIARLAGDFSGSLSTTVRYFSFCANQFVGSETYQLQNVRVSVRAPLRPTPLSPDLPPAAGNENNPINLVVGQTTVGDSLAPGSVFLASALRFGATSPGVILQYWNLTLNGAALSGRLVEDNREAAAAANLLSAWKEFGCFPGAGFILANQYDISEGTTLTGTLTRNAVQLRIVGNTFDTSRPFVTDITANRAG